MGYVGPPPGQGGGGYAPPNQGGYAPPNQGGYVPPPQGGYYPPPQAYGGPVIQQPSAGNGGGGGYNPGGQGKLFI